MAQRDVEMAPCVAGRVRDCVKSHRVVLRVRYFCGGE